MAYTPELMRLIQVVEKTRPARLAKARKGEDFPPLSLEERQRRLRYHPDFNDETAGSCGSARARATAWPTSTPTSWRRGAGSIRATSTSPASTTTRTS